MAYNKTNWQDRIVDGSNVVQEGTPLSATNMNKIEAGIEAAHADDFASDNIIGKRTVQNPTADTGTSNDFLTALLNLFTTAIRNTKNLIISHATDGTHAWDKITNKPVDATQSVSGFMSSTDKGYIDTLYSRINSVVKVNLGGTGSALTATLNPVPSSYWDGMIVIGVMPNVSSTTDVTLQLNSLAAKPIKRYGSDGSIQSLPAGALKPYYTYIFASVSYNSCWVVLELTKPIWSDILNLPSNISTLAALASVTNLNEYTGKTFASGAEYKYHDTSSRTGTNTAFATAYSVRVNHSGRVDEVWEMRSSSASYTVTARIMINGVQYSNEMATVGTAFGTLFVMAYGGNLKPGDIITLEVKVANGGTWYTQNFGLMGSNYEKLA